jgi:RimJ/RimL family protein N-acetyltransferase
MVQLPTSTIETDRLRLVPLHAADAAEMVAVLADPALYAFMGGGPPTLPELDARYRRWVAGSPRPDEVWHNWTVRLRTGAEAIGHVQATVGNGESAEIAWVVGVPWQGRRYATEAAQALVAWLSSAGVTTITAHIHHDNTASAGVATNAGLEPTDEIDDGEVVWRSIP